MTTKTCKQCGTKFEAKKSSAVFCSSPCRKTFNNNRMTRGALLYDAFMAARYDRKKAEALGIDRTFISRMAEMFAAMDAAEGVDASWRNPCEFMEENKARVNARVGTVKIGRGK